MIIIMKKMKIILSAVCAVAMFFAVCAFASCSDGGGENVSYPEREILTAEVGYTFVLPAWLTKSGSNFSVSGPDGAAVEVQNGGFFLAKTGDYTISYKAGGNSASVKLEAADSEAPRFYPLWETYSSNQHFPVNVKIGQEKSLRDIFKPYDNGGGTVELRFVLIYNSELKVVLGPNDTFTPQAGYYDATVYATDEAGNTSRLEQRLTAVA